VSKTNLQLEWENRVKGFKANGLGAPKWHTTNDAKVCQLHYWLCKEKIANLEKL